MGSFGDSQTVVSRLTDLAVLEWMERANNGLLSSPLLLPPTIAFGKPAGSLLKRDPSLALTAHGSTVLLLAVTPWR